MPQKRKVYPAVKFQSATLRNVESRLWALHRSAYAEAWGDSDSYSALPTASEWTKDGHEFSGSVTTPAEEWTFESVGEWLAAHKADSTIASWFSIHTGWGSDLTVSLMFDGTQTSATVKTNTRDAVETIYELLDEGVESGRVVPGELSDRLSGLVSIFIGHGGSSAWRDLKDHLQDKHQFTVVAYEMGVRAGLSVQEVLDDMVNKAGFALLVHTAEDSTDEGDALRARQNVVHETGLFQGALGFRRAVILREKGCEGFSNVVGTTEIRFERGRIAEIFGDVVATIHREFGGRPIEA